MPSPGTVLSLGARLRVYSWTYLASCPRAVGNTICVLHRSLICLTSVARPRRSCGELARHAKRFFASTGSSRTVLGSHATWVLHVESSPVSVRQQTNADQQRDSIPVQKYTREPEIHATRTGDGRERDTHDTHTSHRRHRRDTDRYVYMIQTVHFAREL